ncbi:phosphoglycolate phosphatase [Rhodoligotrophos appendicifer]|uniref:HAD family hydrolase n=1 Tax=Rhodoligotrophos appendicifer TaxID=987056 RepID=UPI0011850E07|nr:HAD family hydrolase [Rhodoligotrophos appendicifer]
MPFRGILFDKDGTLINFQASWGPAVKSLALRFAEGDEETALSLMIAAGFDPLTENYRPGSVIAAGTSVELADLWRPGLSAAARQSTIERIDDHFARAAGIGAVPICELAPVLSALKSQGYILGVATNDATHSAEICIAGLGVRDWFLSIHGWDSVPNPKPAPDMVHAFCRVAGLIPEEVVVVGDNRHDLLMAAAADVGLKVGVLSGSSDQSHLHDLADLLISDISQLQAALENHGRLAG